MQQKRTQSHRPAVARAPDRTRRPTGQPRRSRTAKRAARPDRFRRNQASFRADGTSFPFRTNGAGRCRPTAWLFPIFPIFLIFRFFRRFHHQKYYKKKIQFFFNVCFFFTFRQFQSILVFFSLIFSTKTNHPFFNQKKNQKNSI